MIKIISSAVLLCTIALCTSGQGNETEGKVLPPEIQIKIAVQAAPEEFRDGAKVYGYSEDGQFITLREGTNGFICLAPDAKTDVYYAYCYPESLEPFMARGRELQAQGKGRERDKIREQEYKAGKLPIPQTPTTMYAYWGSADQLNPETGEISDARRRYVVYIPYAKASDLGLPNKGNDQGIPWLMDEGSYKAHIMITPAPDQN